MSRKSWLIASLLCGCMVYVMGCNDSKDSDKYCDGATVKGIITSSLTEFEEGTAEQQELIQKGYCPADYNHCIHVESGVACSACEDGKLQCNGKCTDVLSSNENCGKCGVTCDGVCANGKCYHNQENCSPDETKCLLAVAKDTTISVCVNPKDKATCGATCDNIEGQACNAEQTCNGTSCVCDNPEYIGCGDHCIDPKTNGSWCGAYGDCKADKAGSVCNRSLGFACVNGQCKCPNGFVECDGKCIDPKTDNLHCGASGECTPGTEYYGTLCDPGMLKGIIDLSKYKRGKAMEYSQCIAGQCICTEGGNCEVAPDEENVVNDGHFCIKSSYIRCGGIGNCDSDDFTSMHYKGTKCQNGYQCEVDICIIRQDSSGTAAPDCPSGQTQFKDTDPSKNYYYCLDNAVAETVKEIKNQELVCNYQYCNFDEDMGNGCETPINSERACGSCTNACKEGESCKPAGLHGTYKCVCDKDGYSTCNGSCTDIANNHDNCGACGTKCGEKQICSENACTDCPAGMISCNNECIHPNDDSLHIASCADATMKCSDGFADCNQNPADGCEVSTATDFFNCGGCGTLCDDSYSFFKDNKMACVDSKCCNTHILAAPAHDLPCCDSSEERYTCRDVDAEYYVCSKNIKDDEAEHHFTCTK